MKKKRILFTSELPGNSFKENLNHNEFEIFLAEDIEGETLQKKVEKVNPSGIIALLSDKIDKNVIDSAPALEVISNYAVGYNNIDVTYCHEKGIYVTNTPDVLTDATADIAILLILMVSRRAVSSDRFVRTGHFKGWGPQLFVGKSLQNKKLGIIGMGRIGLAVAKRAVAFGMDVIYCNRNKVEKEKEKAVNAQYVEIEQLLKESDFISLHLPYTPEVNHLIGKNEFGIMKKDAVLINTARGPLVDEKALCEALISGEIYGAGLDVYENEPAVEKGLMDLENVVLLPHIGSATEETRSEMAEMAISGCISVLSGSVPENIVKPF